MEKVSKIEAKMVRKWEKIWSKTRHEKNNNTRCRFSRKMSHFGVGFGAKLDQKSIKNRYRKSIEIWTTTKSWGNRTGVVNHKVFWATICRLQTTDCRPVTEDHRSAGLQETIEEDKWQATSNKLPTSAAVCPSQGGAGGLTSLLFLTFCWSLVL